MAVFGSLGPCADIDRRHIIGIAREAHLVAAQLGQAAQPANRISA